MNTQAKKTTIQLLKYGVIGASNTLITLVAFYLVNTVFGFSYLTANVVGYALGLVNSFIWNRNWVFRTKKNLAKEMVLFGSGFLICYALQLGVSGWLLQYPAVKDLELAWLPMKNTGENIVMCVSMVVYTLTNYVYNRFITFK